MTIKEGSIIKKVLERSLKNPLEALRFYANPTRIKWYLNKKSGKLPSIFPADKIYIIHKIKNVIIKKVTAEGITKNCILTNSNFNFTTKRIKIKKGDILSFSIKLNKKIKDSIIYKININKDILFLRKINEELFKTKSWLEVNLDLNKYKNKQINIKFSTKATSKENLRDSIVWSEPIILNKDIKKTNVILISIDSCRKRNFSCYGYHRKTTPNIDKMKSIKFNKVFAQTIWTGYSHETMFTGLYPITHRIRKKENKEIKFLPEIFRNKGYLTYSHNGAGRLGPEILSKGFDYFIYRKLDRKSKTSSAEDIINSSIKGQL